ncbi:MAG: outer membrane protein assembly factor BamA [Candidatus Omnitrophica bacterium]|nr:outer membrane protein assembly factor BamA [Candidatus Omnitrophota bacterium]
MFGKRLLLIFLFFMGLSFVFYLCAEEEQKPAASSQEAEAPASPPAAPRQETETSTAETPETAQEERPNRVIELEVVGNQIVSTSTILGKIKSQKGGALVQETINEDIKRLYATGFFHDIKMEIEELAEGYKLIVRVVEKPVVKQIILEGFTKFNDEKLRKELKFIEGQILDQRAVKQGVEAIRKLYRDKGFKFVDVQSEVDVNRDAKEATVYVRIEEGAKYRIKTIIFEGADSMKHKRLRKLMKTKKKGWIRRGIFKHDEFEQDVERLQLFYQQEGYLDVKVTPEFEYDRAKNWIFIKILVDEGKHYVTGELRIEGNRLFPESEIWQRLEMLPGSTYSQYYLAKELEKVREYYEERGYMDARILPDVKLNRESGKVDIVYQIQEGDLYFVEKVIIRGNTKTRDRVIRRELRIRPGERFDGEKLRKSKQRLENLGFFEEVTYDTEPSTQATNRKDLIFRVKEKRTGELSFGGGVSSIDRFVGFAEISQRNFDLLNWPRFTGGGQSLAIRARVGSISQDYNVSFYEPYLFNKPVSLGTDVFNVRRDNRNVDFDEERRGFSVTLSRLFKDVFRLGSGYTLERVELDDISDDAPRTVRDFAGRNWLSRWKAFTTYDTRDNVFNPTKGLIANLNGELVGSFLGGDQDFYVLNTGITKYWTFFKKHTVETRLQLATAQEFGDSEEVPIFDRFYAGGLGTVRGFNYRRVGPIEAGDAVGGETLALANLEYTFPIPKLEAFRLAGFIDVGHVNPDSYNIDFDEFAVSIGPGIKIKTPIGPVAFYYGFPIANRDTEDRNGRFEFSLSRGF